MPSLLETVRKWVFKNAPVAGTSKGFNRDPKVINIKFLGYQLVVGGGGRDNFESSKTDLSILAAAIERDSYLAQAVMRYAELLFVSGWTLKTKNEQALLYVKQRLEIIAIATKIPTEEFFFGIGHDIVRYANCFIVKARAKGGKGLPPGLSLTPILPSKDPIGGYFRLPPQTITISRDTNGNITKYRQTPIGGGDPIDFNPEDMIHICVNRPVGEGFGEPFLAPVIEDIRLLRKVEENVATLLYRHIFPLMKYKVGLPEKGMEATPEEMETLQRLIENLPTDGALLMPERHDIESVPIETLEVKPFLDYFENRVFSGLGMSQVDFGRGDTANRNTADAMTGNKADRVKGWQQQIQIQIDKYIIDELLIEGGYDPLVNPDFDVNFSFNEVQQEQRIKHDVHEVFKFTNNVQTWDETRKNLGMDPTADESRLYVNMIGSIETQNRGNNQAANLSQPTNQYGTRSGPKRSTEHIQESKVTSETNQVILLLKQYKSAFLSEYKKYQNNPMLQPIWLSFLPFEMEFQKTIQMLAQGQFLFGAESAAKQMQFTRSVSRSQSFDLYLSDAIQSIIQQMRNVLQQNALQIGDAELIFQQFESKMKRFTRTEMMRAYNVGYATQVKKLGISKSDVTLSAEDCMSCSESGKNGHTFVIDSKWDDVDLIGHVPPYHPNCECLLRVEGGESIASF